MAAETIFKLQPNRTMYLRGFDRRGACAALCEATDTSFKVYGVFRDMADFAVVVLWDADNFFEHYSMKYLPDFNFIGLVLTFDLHYQGLQPIDSPKYNWIDWATLDVLKTTGETMQVRLWDHATLQSGTFSVASGEITVQANYVGPYDRITLWLNNVAFDHIVPWFPDSCLHAVWWQGNPNYVHWVKIGDTTYSCIEDGYSSAQIAQNIAAQINANDPYCAASTGGTYGNEITISLRPGQYGPVNVTSSDGSAPSSIYRPSPESIAGILRDQINQANWPAFGPTIAVMASTSGATLTIKAARYGTVNTDGTSVSWVSGDKFTAIAPGSPIFINGNQYTVDSVSSATSLTLTTSAGTQSGVRYLAERGGDDGNMITLYATWKNNYLKFDKSVLKLSGGSSDVTWRVSLDFSALGIDQVRQMWLTLAPKLADGAAYQDTEWTATFTNWTVSDSTNSRPLKVAGPGSVRIGSRDPRVRYRGLSWERQWSNNLYGGTAMQTSEPLSELTIQYTCNAFHDLWLGTRLYRDCGIVYVSVDGGAPRQLDCYLDSNEPILTRRRIWSDLSPGTHSVTIYLSTTKNQNSTGTNFLFDYLEAVVPSDVPDPQRVYQNVSLAIDYDTDHTYKIPPARLVWNLDRLGMRGAVNEYVGVFWWNQRKRVGGSWKTWTVRFGGTWQGGDEVFLSIGSFTMGKSVFPQDTISTIAAHFKYFINHSLVSVWAETTETPGELKIHVRTPIWSDTKSASKSSANGTITESGDLSAGIEGTWVVDDEASNPINWPARKWHSDLFAQVAAKGWGAVAAFSMELVNPPDDPASGKVYAARFYEGNPVETDVGFANLRSTHCAFSATMLEYQKAAYKEMAKLMSDAGLTPWLQFGEFLWWFFSSKALVVTDVNGNEITVNADHGFSSGDRVVIAGTSVLDGTRTVTPHATDPKKFTVGGEVNPGPWTGTGQVRGGSMAYYDADTQAAAMSQLGRPLARFTCQDDDPEVNGGQDANFLAQRLKSHMDAIRQHVLASYPNAKFEWLFPYDVNHPSCYYTNALPYPQGGRMNARVNLPQALTQKTGSGLDRIKMEALSWGSFYRNWSRAAESISFPFKQLQWPKDSCAYLIPWFNGGCFWGKEYLECIRHGLPLINFWAFDHACLMGWPLAFPEEERTARVM